MSADWVRNIRAQCSAAEVAFFFKQWGESESPRQEGRSMGGPIASFRSASRWRHRIWMQGAKSWRAWLQSLRRAEVGPHSCSK